MPKQIKAYKNNNEPIIPVQNDILKLTYFNIIKLNNSETYSQKLKDFESVFVILKGNCDIKVNGINFSEVGKRDNIWSGKADSVYAPSDAKVEIKSNRDNTEIAVAGGFCRQDFEPFRITPDEVEMVEVGSLKAHCRREIYHILGHNAKGRAGNLLVSELYADGGCWSGYPPHKHDTDTGKDNQFEETAFEEVYYYKFNPETGFGAQIVYQSNGKTDCYRTQDGDTVIIEGGYHPTVTTPGHREYIFTILVGKTQRSLIQNFHENHRHLMDKIPGIGAMRDKFKQD
jgi:5-deoxy-glucuronate isomerase